MLIRFGFLKECMVSLIFSGINLFPDLLLSLAPRQSCDILHNTYFILFDVLVFRRSHVFTGSCFQQVFGFTKVSYWMAIAVNFVTNVPFLFSSDTTFRFKKQFMQCVFCINVDVILWDLSIYRNFSLVHCT